MSQETPTSQETAVIIGAGPAGLTAAYELLQRTDVRPIVIEKSAAMGGLSQTVRYKGNRIDIGGHRFFSKSQRVMDWWLRQMPMQAAGGPDPDRTDHVMLLRPRRSRIYYGRKFFDYPVSASLDTLRNLGPARALKIAASYARSMLWPIRDVTSLEHFFINRFGRELYRTFFESYTEKVWGRPCSAISAEWGAQRIKGLSVSKALLHALKKPCAARDVVQRDTETSLIEQFLYPKFGPGQMWEHVARQVQDAGGEIFTEREVRRIGVAGNRIMAVEAVDTRTGRGQIFHADHFFSTMPVKQLVRSLTLDPPDPERRIAEGLVYRDFITVGLLVDELKVKEHPKQGRGLIRDNWIYIQEPDVQVGRMQVFNNWSPYLVADADKVWIGMEYFCNEHDDLWIKTDRGLIALAAEELARIGIIEPSAVRDATVIRMPKTYPAYFGTFEQFGQLRSWLDRLENLFLIGRNGMHRYNNMDHSMLTAMVAVDNILEGRTDKSNVWAVNAEQEYHEAHKEEPAQTSETLSEEEQVAASTAELADALRQELSEHCDRQPSDDPSATRQEPV